MSGNNLPLLGLLPASFHMIDLESAIFREQVKRQVDHKYRNGNEYRYLGKNRKTLTDEFDYVIIDCPPNLYNVTKNALFHSDYILSSVHPECLVEYGAKAVTESFGIDRPPFCSQNGRKARGVGGGDYEYDPNLKDHSLGMKAIEGAFRSFKEDNPEALTVNERTVVFQQYPIRDYIAHSEAVQENNQPLCLYQELGKAYARRESQ